MITIELPYPASSGGRMKSWNMLSYLQSHFEISLVTPLKYGCEHLKRFVEKTQLNDFYHDKVEIPRNAKSLALSYVKARPLNVLRSGSDVLKRKVSEIAERFDYILLDHYESFQYLPENYSGKVILHTHNATYLMWERYAESGESLAIRSASALEAYRVKRYEREACQRADLIFASPNDIDNLVAIGAERSKFRETFHLGDDSQLNLPDMEFDDTELKLFYVGTLNWEANIDGLLWFFKNVWPKLKLRHPKLSFEIAGGKPDPRIVEAVAQLPDVELLGFVEDLEPHFISSRVFVSPLLFGSGIKVKVLNAMCRGIPIVTTPVGAEGLATEDMKHLSINNTESEMIDSIDQLLVDKAVWTTLRNESRALVKSRYTWNKVLGFMVDEIIALAPREISRGAV